MLDHQNRADVRVTLEAVRPFEPIIVRRLSEGSRPTTLIRRRVSSREQRLARCELLFYTAKTELATSAHQDSGSGAAAGGKGRACPSAWSVYLPWGRVAPAKHLTARSTYVGARLYTNIINALAHHMAHIPRRVSHPSGLSTS